jgi:hypothetical protein
MTFGAEKYEDHNWKLVEPERFLGAMIRHLVHHFKGKVIDDDSGLPTLSHLACDALFLLWHHLNGNI